MPHLQVSLSTSPLREETPNSFIPRRTNRIRKVKCDEGRPSCCRCVSTGRVCDGYGIWGGGENAYRDRKLDHCSSSGPLAPLSRTALSVLSVGTEEARCFEWFQCRTAKKIPGLFVLTFWETLLFQASIDQPAVLHAVLALSSVHKRDVLHEQAPGGDEQFMLQHYIKAISHLQPHLAAKDVWSVRIALITCVVFICLELLRGHFRTAQTHLQNGLKVLREIQTNGRVDTENEILTLKTSCYAAINDWILEAFARLHIQEVLFQQSCHCPRMFFRAEEPESPNPVAIFETVNEAWQQLERLLYNVAHLAKQRVDQQQLSNSASLVEPSPKMQIQQQDLQEKLAQWLDTYRASRNSIKGIPDDVGEDFAYLLLSMHHAMATVMAGTCLAQDDESIFDEYADHFVSLVEQSTKMWEARSSKAQLMPQLRLDMARSVVDIGWMPPLYYTALKCRVHRVRLQAVRLLESTSHREGIWDSKIAARIARKVMEIEERDWLRDDGDDRSDDVLLSSPSGLRDLTSTLPPSHRIRQVHVVLSDGPTDSVLLFYKQKQPGRGWKSFSTEYSLSSQCWTCAKSEDDEDAKIARAASTPAESKSIHVL